MGYGPRSANQGAWTGQSQDPSLIRTSLTDKVLGKGSQESLSDVQEHRIQRGVWKDGGLLGLELRGGCEAKRLSKRRFFGGELGNPGGKVKGEIH